MVEAANKACKARLTDLVLQAAKLAWNIITHLKGSAANRKVMIKSIYSLIYYMKQCQINYQPDLVLFLAEVFFQAAKENAKFGYGLWSEDGVVAGEMSLGAASGEIGPDGSVTLSCPSLESSSPLDGVAEMVAHVEVLEAGSGRSSRAVARAQLFPEAHLVGLASGTRRFEVGKAIEVQGVVVDWDGRTTDAVSTVDVELFLMEA